MTQQSTSSKSIFNNIESCKYADERPGIIPSPLYSINEDIYDPTYSDMLRVSFMHQFRRGKLSDLVSLLSGRDFETKEFRDDIVVDSYKRLDLGIKNAFIQEGEAASESFIPEFNKKIV